MISLRESIEASFETTVNEGAFFNTKKRVSSRDCEMMCDRLEEVADQIEKADPKKYATVLGNPEKDTLEDYAKIVKLVAGYVYGVVDIIRDGEELSYFDMVFDLDPDEVGESVADNLYNDYTIKTFEKGEEVESAINLVITNWNAICQAVTRYPWSK